MEKSKSICSEILNLDKKFTFKSYFNFRVRYF